jgi:Mn2+/Fe2+ NRAMP family transporter
VAESPITIPEPQGVLVEPWSFGKLRRLAALFGPAAIVASVAIGAGETIVVVEAGSWAGYDLLWLVLASVLVKGICVTYLLGRYTAVSGEPIGQRLVRVPGPRGWVLWLIIALELGAAGPLWAAVARPCGDLLYYLAQQSGLMSAATDTGWSAEAWSALLASTFVLAALGLGVSQSFRWMERQQLWICAILVVGTIVGTLIVRPEFAATLIGSFSFGKFPEPLPPWAPTSAREHPLLTMATAFGYVGSSVMGYLAYTNWISLHGWGLCGHPDIAAIRSRAAAGSPRDYLPNDPRQADRMRRLLMPLRLDVGLGAVVLLIVTASFMLAGAAVLYPMLADGQIAAAFQGWNLLTDQAYVWRSIHPALVWLYYLCILAALWGTLQVYPQVYTRVTHEFFAAIWPERSFPLYRFRIALATYVLATTLPLLWADVEFSTLTAIVAFLATNAGVAVALLAALYLDRQLPPLYRTRPGMFAAGVASAIVLVAVSAISGWGIAARFAG